MNFTERQKKLLEFAKKQHGDQLRKYSHEPYWRHLVSVAQLTQKYVNDGVEIALCHDLLEDTDCTATDLLDELKAIGYTATEAEAITKGVVELTDVFVKENYPQLNRRERKRREARRLGAISPLAQSVKYADLTDNISSIMYEDVDFGKVFVQEAIDILNHMRAGNIHLLIECCHKVQEAREVLRIK